jgi:beta-glucosidase
MMVGAVAKMMSSSVRCRQRYPTRGETMNGKKNKGMAKLAYRCVVICVVMLIVGCYKLVGQQTVAERPWMDKHLSAEARANLVLAQLTLDEKILLLHGEGMAREKNLPPEVQAVQGVSNGGVGLVLGVPRLGIPPIQMSDAAYGVRHSAENGRYSTALPSNLASAASWDTEAACRYGTLIGHELRAQGYDMTLGGGVNLAREPRNGRTFEYMGEDPILAGTMVGQRIRCEGNEHVISDMKHYALNDQESGRTMVDVKIGERAARESDLLAMEIGFRTGNPKAVMCSYNAVNGDYACENRWLLTDILKKEWGFKGFVVSDWGATHSTEKASAAGLDQEQQSLTYYGKPLKAAVEAGRVPMAELDDHVRRVLWAEFASGIVDDPPRRFVVDPQAGFDLSRHIAEQSAVLLRNERRLLPLDPDKMGSIAVIGEHADAGMMSGGGSAQVDPPGELSGGNWLRKVWFPTSPLEALRAKAAKAKITFASGQDIAEAVAQAKAADVAIVFAWQWEYEDHDLANLSLPDDQDKLIAAVTAANPRTIVVLETGSVITMPWLEHAGAVLEMWYAGSKGADAMANLVFGAVNPSGKLPLTFPIAEADLPRPVIAGPAPGARQGKLSFTVNYSEGVKVGYKWYDAEHKAVLFPFGFGLSYTTFAYAGLKVSDDGARVSFRVTNTGQSKGAEVAEIYASLPASAGEPPKRLIGFKKVELNPGEGQTLEVAIDPLYLSIWDEASKKWTRPAGEYRVMVGGSSAELPLTAKLSLR